MDIPENERCQGRVGGRQCTRRAHFRFRGRLDACAVHFDRAVEQEEAAISACEGISTDSLTPGLVRELVRLVQFARDACLFDEDDGLIGMTNDAYISDHLFQEFCKALKGIKVEE